MQRLIQGLESSVALAGCNGGFDFLSWFAQTLIVPRIGLFERLGYAHDPRFAWAASAIAALGILLVVWAWFPQRWRRGQVAYQCPRCRYDLRGIVQEKAYPLRCSECALDIGSEHLLTAPRRGWRLPGVALLLFTAAYLTTIWPEVQRDGWTRLVPSTVLVLQPIDVATWPPARRRPVTFPVTPLSPLEALARRLYLGRLWSWQEWVLFKRVESSCRARDDYGITPAQYDMAVSLYTTPADAPDAETFAGHLASLADSTGVDFLIDWEILEANGWRGDDLVQPVQIRTTVADELDRLLYSGSTYETVYWDITPDGVVVTDKSRAAVTRRARLYDVSLLVNDSFSEAELADLVTGTINPRDWTSFGGSVNSLFGIANRLVVLAPTRVHFQVENLLNDLADAATAMPGSVRPHRPLNNPRAFTVKSEYALGMLDYLRIERTISREALRAAGPTLDDGVTAEELDACDRAAFGLLDRFRRLPE